LLFIENLLLKIPVANIRKKITCKKNIDFFKKFPKDGKKHHKPPASASRLSVIFQDTVKRRSYHRFIIPQRNNESCILDASGSVLPSYFPVNPASINMPNDFYVRPPRQPIRLLGKPPFD
jgi:hypothetical protein